MSSRARKILEDALSLPEEDRLLIAAELKGSVIDTSASPDEVESAWRAEIVNRLRSIEDGTAVLHDWDEVERELLDLVKHPLHPFAPTSETATDQCSQPK